MTLQIGFEIFCQPPPTRSVLDLFLNFFNSDFFPDFVLGQPGYNDMCASGCAVISRLDCSSHLAISIMLRTFRLIYFKRDNNKTVYNACVNIMFFTTMILIAKRAYEIKL